MLIEHITEAELVELKALLEGMLRNGIAQPLIPAAIALIKSLDAQVLRLSQLLYEAEGCSL